MISYYHFCSWESFLQKEGAIENLEYMHTPLIRVVVMKEIDFQSRKILFDSSCVSREVISINNSTSLSQYDEIANNYGYKVRSELYCTIL